MTVKAWPAVILRYAACFFPCYQLLHNWLLFQDMGGPGQYMPGPD